MLVRVIYRREKQVRGRDRGERGNLLSLVYQRSSKERRINPWDPPLSQSSQKCEETVKINQRFISILSSQIFC
jgi:hypothetical protein